MIASNPPLLRRVRRKILRKVMEWMPPPGGIAMCQAGDVQIAREEEASMKEVTIVGVDLAKRVFQLHGAAADGTVVFRKKLSRAQFLPFLAARPACTVAMEACATAHHWGREIGRLGHRVRLIPPAYVKPFVKRQKNDTADAEAIAEAAARPTMRFVAVKTEAQQARATTFRARDLLVRQRTQLSNALRGHLAEYGVVAAQGMVSSSSGWRRPWRRLRVCRRRSARSRACILSRSPCVPRRSRSLSVRSASRRHGVR
jgi:transposase